MFKGFACDRITVPSCEDHNSRKGGRDQAIVNAMLSPLRNMLQTWGHDRSKVTSDVEKAIREAGPSVERTKQSAFSKPLFIDPPEQLGELPDMAYLVGAARIGEWVRQLTAALVFDATRPERVEIDWPGTLAWSPTWIPSPEGSSLPFQNAFVELAVVNGAAMLLDSLCWRRGWSAKGRGYPETLFYFEIHAEAENVIFRHRFYGSFTWYVLFHVSGGLMGKLDQRTGGR
jgi:hypothetical protein